MTDVTVNSGHSSDRSGAILTDLVQPESGQQLRQLSNEGRVGGTDDEPIPLIGPIGASLTLMRPQMCSKGQPSASCSSVDEAQWRCLGVRQGSGVAWVPLTVWRSG